MLDIKSEQKQLLAGKNRVKKRSVKSYFTFCCIVLENYGDILYRCGEPEEALIMWKKAMEIGGEITDELKQKIETGVLSK